MSPAAAAGLRVGFPQGASLSIALGYSRWHVRDSISFCGITGECFPTQVRAGFDLLRTEGLLHLRLPPTSVLELVIGGFAGIRTHCGEGLCDWRRPLQVGPVIGLEFRPSVSGRQFFARLIGYGSVRRSAAAYTAESGAEKEYHPIVVQVAIGALVR
jgi:hypothetical protein